MNTTPNTFESAPAAVIGSGHRAASNGVRTGTLIAAVVTTGLTAGVFVDWSNAIMPGLGGADDKTFVEAFQALDAAIVSPLFIGAGFMGSLLLIGLSAVLNIGGESRKVQLWICAALGCWLAVFAITFGVHEPLNQQLRAADGLESDADFAAARALLDEAMWTTWNTIRALVASMAFGCLIGALLTRGRRTATSGERTLPR